MYRFPGVRYVFTVAGFLGFCVIYAIRVNINVAIVAMVNASVYDTADNMSSGECKSNHASNSSTPDASMDGEFLWSPNVQAMVLGSFYYGYWICQIPGGRLAESYSGKWVFGVGTLITALLTLLTPLAAQYSVDALIIIRALEGLAQGVTMPAMHCMIGRWLPDTEKAFLSTFIYCGIHIGTVVTMFLSGVLCNSHFLGGWPSAFYVIGIFGCFWFLFWMLFVSDSPLSHPCITKTELEYITSNQKMKINLELPPIPWRKILTSLPFWALVIVQTGGDWSFYTVINDLPTYFGTILNFKIEQNGFLSSFPHFIQPVVGLTVGFLTDLAVRRKLATNNFIRKFCTSVCGLGPALGFIGVCFARCDVTMNVAFFTFAISVGGFYYSGYNLSHLDLSPEYAGTLMGISNTVSNLTGFLAPLVVGVLTQNHQTLHQWQIIFGIVVVVLCFCTTFFLLFGSTKKQEWLSHDDQESLAPAEKETIDSPD